MALVIPFSSVNPINKFSTTLDGVQYGFRARWNSSDNYDPLAGVRRGAWYIDISDNTGEPIATGIKVTLGTILGRQFQHTLFRTGVLVAVDLSGKGREPGIDDFGTRVQVLRLSIAEVLSLRVTSDHPDAAAIAAAKAVR